MHATDIEAVWQTLDRERLAEIAARGPKPVFATISGAHLYGFASPDSDIDLRGAFLHPTDAMLGLHPPDETVTIEDKTIDLDWVAHDLRKFARLMTRHNGYVLEQLYSPLVVVDTPEFGELRALGKACITRPTVRHYRGFARGRRGRLAESAPTVKHLLYAYRVFLSGIHLMQSGEVCSNIAVLNERFRRPEIHELVARKQAGAEKMELSPGDLELHNPILDGLERELTEAYEKSALPEEPEIAPLDAFVVRTRLNAPG
ncbi:MAG: nucleotidyltransferase domain-containing protein [Myxococcota bacterium]